jgi:hypothetical protein
MSIDEQPTTFLDFAKVINYGKFSERIVDDVKSFRGPLISAFPEQRGKMKLPYDTMPIIWMTLAEPVIIISKLFE